MHEVDSTLTVDGWECHALLVELLRMFDRQLQLGSSAADIVDYQSERKVASIRKLVSSRFADDSSRICANMLRSGERREEEDADLQRCNGDHHGHARLGQ